MVRRRAVLAVVSLLLGSVVVVVSSPEPASAAPSGTIVFLKDHNVWIMPAGDPGAARPLTTDGTEEDAYHAPAADDRGVVYAVRTGGAGGIVRMDHDGNTIGAPFRPPQALDIIDALRPSPDGRLLAYTSLSFTRNPLNPGEVLIVPVFFVDFAYADGRDPAALPHYLEGAYGDWIDDTQLIYDPVVPVDPSIDGFNTYTFGEPDGAPWFDSCRSSGDVLDPFVGGVCDIVGVADVSRDLAHAAAVQFRSDTLGDPASVVVWNLHGAPPAAPTKACEHAAAPLGQGAVDDVMWSPDGDALVWDLVTPSGETPPANTGLYVATGFGTRSCASAFSTAELVVPGGSQPYWSAAPFGAPPDPSVFGDLQSLVPERVLDTRAGPGQVGYSGPKPGPEATVEVDVTGVGTSNVPDDAEAVVLNITGVDATAAGYVTVWPCGQPRPTASNLNLTAGQTAPNLVIAKVGTNGKVCISTQSGTHLIADLAGYFPATSSYEPLVPERVLETRADQGQVGYSGPKPGPEATVEVDVTGVGTSNVPDDAEAVVLNITGVDATAAGYVTVWPCGQPRPTASNLNLTAGQTAPNLVIAKVGANGKVCISTQSGTHLIADLAGYFPATSSYEPLVPERVLETRADQGQVGYSGPKPGPEATVEVDVTGVGTSNVPDDAEAVVLNITGVDATAAGYVTVWPCGQPRPTASNLNLTAGQTAPNLVIAKVGANGKVCISTQSGTHLIADLAGYFPS